MPIPHQFADRIIREALHDPQNLRELLEFVLGEDLASQLDYDNIEYEDTRFLLPDMHGREADLICRVRLRGEEESTDMYICILIEHQSEPEDCMPLRMLEYGVCHWRRLWDLGPKHQTASLPGILPIVFYTGQRPWRSKRQLGDLIQSQDFPPAQAPLWPIAYLNLAEHSTDELLRSKRAWHKALAVARAEGEEDLGRFSKVLGAAAHDIDKLPDIDQPRHWRLLEFILRWVAARRPDEEHEVLYKVAVQQIRPEHHEQIRDMSSKIRLTFEEASELRAQERYERGKAEAELETCRTLLRTLLEKRFGALSDVLRCRIEDSMDIEALRGWFDQALDIASPDELTL